MDWTAEQVWELVKDWPEEARAPFWFGYAESHPDGPTFYEQCGPVMPVTAAHVLIGSGLAWLAHNVKNRAVVVDYYKHDPAYVIRTEDQGGPAMSNEETLLEAVSAAVLAAKGGSNG